MEYKPIGMLTIDHQGVTHHMLFSTLPFMLAPNDLAHYAEFHGWARGAPYGEDANIYVSRHGEMIVLPSNVDAHDYMNLADQAVRALADLSDIDPRTMYDEIRRFDRDTIRIRAIGNDTKDGSIDFKNGNLLIENAWNVLKSLANDTKKSAGLEGQRAESLLAGFRLEQTEIGSYAVAISTPSVPHFTGDQVLLPPQRHLSQRMADALSATRQLADARGDPATDLGDHNVVSAAWCTSVADIVEPFDGVEFGLTWARTAPLQQIRPTTFDSEDDLQFLRETADRLKSDAAAEEYHNVKFPGYVEVLKNPKPEHSQSTVTIKATFDARDITIRAVLTPDDYRRACNASPTKSNVVVSGSRLIKKNAQSWVLEGARIEEVIASMDAVPVSKDQSRMALST